jgi:sugar phosphate permease
MSANKAISNIGIKKTLKYRWVVWSIMVMAYGLVYFHSFSMGVVKPTLINEFNLSEQSFVSIGNVYFYLYLLMQIPTGILADALGSRLTSFFGTLVAAIGITIFSFASSLPFLYIGRSLVGLGTAVIFVSIIKIQSNWFKESEFGTITGLTCFIGVMGGTLAQTPLALMVGRIGWRMSFRLIGFISLVIAFLIFWIVRNKPEDLGMTPINKPIEGRGKTSVKDVLKGVVKVFVNPRTWPLFLMHAAFYGSYVVITGYYGTSFIMDVYGKSMVVATNYLIPSIVGASVGSVFVGTISDKIRSRKIPIFVFGCLYVITWGALVFMGGGAPSEGFLSIIMFMIGFASCAYVISWPGVKEVNDPQYVGISVAVANIGGFFGSIVIPQITANIIANNQGTLSSVELYQKAFFWVFIAICIGFVASMFTKETRCENIYKS